MFSALHTKRVGSASIQGKLEEIYSNMIRKTMPNSRKKIMELENEVRKALAEARKKVFNEADAKSKIMNIIIEFCDDLYSVLDGDKEKNFCHTMNYCEGIFKGQVEASKPRFETPNGEILTVHNTGKTTDICTKADIDKDQLQPTFRIGDVIEVLAPDNSSDWLLGMIMNKDLTEDQEKNVIMTVWFWNGETDETTEVQWNNRFEQIRIPRMNSKVWTLTEVKSLIASERTKNTFLDPNAPVATILESIVDLWEKSMQELHGKRQTVLDEVLQKKLNEHFHDWPGLKELIRYHSEAELLKLIETNRKEVKAIWKNIKSGCKNCYTVQKEKVRAMSTRFEQDITRRVNSSFLPAIPAFFSSKDQSQQKDEDGLVATVISRVFAYSDTIIPQFLDAVQRRLNEGLTVKISKVLKEALPKKIVDETAAQLVGMVTDKQTLEDIARLKSKQHSINEARRAVTRMNMS